MAATRKKTAGTDCTKLSYEDALDELESIIDSIEKGDLGLEKGLELYRRGDALLKHCRGKLDAAEQELEQISGAESESSATGSAPDADKKQ